MYVWPGVSPLNWINVPYHSTPFDAPSLRVASVGYVRWCSSMDASNKPVINESFLGGVAHNATCDVNVRQQFCHYVVSTDEHQERETPSGRNHSANRPTTMQGASWYGPRITMTEQPPWQTCFFLYIILAWSLKYKQDCYYANTITEVHIFFSVEESALENMSSRGT